jgi:hypothetical protein
MKLMGSLTDTYAGYFSALNCVSPLLPIPSALFLVRPTRLLAIAR